MATLRGSRWVLTILSVLAAGAAPPATRPSSDVDTLLRQLAGDDWSLRQKAQQKLVALGPDAEPALRKWIAQSHDQESVARAEAALRLIAEGRLVGPTPVTLHLHQVDPAGALEELGRQLGQEIATDPPDLWKQKDWPRVTLDADHEPFWKVMLALSAQLDLEPQPSENAAGLRVGEAADAPNWAASPSVVSGPFLLMATGATRTRTVRFAQPADVEQSCELTLVAYVEPKLRPIHDSFSVHIDRATDERGQSLLPADPGELADAVSFTEPDPGRRWEVSIDLKLPPIAPGKKSTATVKGVASVMVPVKLRSIEVTDVLETHDLARRAAGRRLTVQSARRTNGGGVEVTVILFRDELDDEQWRQFADPRDFVHLVDDHGRATPLASVSQSESAEHQATLTLQFAPSAQGATSGPLKFVWQVAEEIRPVRIPFEYRDLPLP